MEERTDLFSSIPEVEFDPINGSYRNIDFPSAKVQLSNRAIQNWTLFGNEVPISGGIQADAGHLLSRAVLGESGHGR